MTEVYKLFFIFSVSDPSLKNFPVGKEGKAMVAVSVRMPMVTDARLREDVKIDLVNTFTENGFSSELKEISPVLPPGIAYEGDILEVVHALTMDSLQARQVLIP